MCNVEGFQLGPFNVQQTDAFHLNSYEKFPLRHRKVSKQRKVFSIITGMFEPFHRYVDDNKYLKHQTNLNTLIKLWRASYQEVLLLVLVKHSILCI